MLEDLHPVDGTVPGPLDVVVDLGATIAMWAADRLVQIDALRRGQLADAAARGARFTDVVMRGVRLELASAMRITEHAAANLLALSEALVDRYPSVLRALGEARITERHAEILVGGLDELEPELRDGIFDRALSSAETQPVGEFRRSLRALVESARVVTSAERQEAALGSRRVFVEPVGDGMAWTHLYGPAVEAHAHYGRVTAIAKTIRAQKARPGRWIRSART